jgi:ribose transport system permease protein
VRVAAAPSIRRAGMGIAIPFATACLFGAACFLFAIFAIAAPNYLTSGNLQQLMRDFAEPGMVAIAMAITILAGGIDLSIGAIFALANFAALFLFRIHGLPLEITIPAVLAVGLLIGSVNGLLVAYLRLKPFLSTLAVLMILRAGYDLTAEAYTTELAIAVHDTTAWRFLGSGVIVGVPVNTIALLVVGAAAQFFLTRLRPGLHIMAVGASQKAARHAGIKVARSLFLAYLLSGALAALAGVFYAARQNSAGSDTGLGWEITALTGVVVGGISLAGGRGTVVNAMAGSAIVFLLVGGLLRLNLPGCLTSATTGIVLILAVGLTIAVGSLRKSGGRSAWPDLWDAFDKGHGDESG